MAEPKKKLSASRSGKRRGHLKIGTNKLIICTKCKSKILPHRVCQVCGYYKQKNILKIKVK